MKSPISVLRTLKRTVSTLRGIDQRLDEVKLNQGLILAEFNHRKQSKHLKDYEFTVFSQWGEDGIIQRLIDVIEIGDETFIEFGVADFFESNCRYLLMKNDWRGFVIDGSASNVKRIKDSYFYWKHDLVAIDAFITKDNINQLLLNSGFREDLGILSIDVDGNDYHILEAIEFFRPRILICEYNAVFGSARKITIPYDANFRRAESHHSCLYCGASLGAVAHLAEKRGYALVGTNSAGNNAFFVRNDLLNCHVEVLSVEEAFVSSRFRESKGARGQLTYISGDQRLALLKDLHVLNVETNRLELL